MIDEREWWRLVVKEEEEASFTTTNLFLGFWIGRQRRRGDRNRLNRVSQRWFCLYFMAMMDFLPFCPRLSNNSGFKGVYI